jgi:hypothetical protein
MEQISQRTIYYFIIIVLSLYIIYYYNEENEYFLKSLETRTLEKDGFMLLYNKDYIKDNFKMKRDVLKVLPKDYMFIDYEYNITNVALSTFHRDVTSSQKIFNTKYPIYTLILYKTDDDLLSVCPNSHKTYPFVWSTIINITGKSGTCFLFDCDLLHAGYMNKCINRKLTQYKICHKDDYNKLHSLHKININKTDKCEITNTSLLIRKLSYYFQLPINYIFYPLLIKKENNNTITGLIQSYIPITFYNNN